MAEGSRLDLSLHQVGRIHVLFRWHSRQCRSANQDLNKQTYLSINPSAQLELFENGVARVATDRSWWRERSGPTRSHTEHGSETLQRPRYWGHQAPGK